MVVEFYYTARSSLCLLEQRMSPKFSVCSRWRVFIRVSSRTARNVETSILMLDFSGSSEEK